LVIRRHLTREAEEYTTNTVNATAAKALEEAGIHLQPGEAVEYIIVDMSGKKKPMKALPLPLYAFDEGYDIEAYTTMALQAVATLLSPFGYDVPRLREVLGCSPPPRQRARPATAQGSLFDP
jgi:DNA polymerase elongation subunit (family B)